MYALALSGTHALKGLHVPQIQIDPVVSSTPVNGGLVADSLTVERVRE